LHLLELGAAEKVRAGEKGAIVSSIGKVEFRVCDSHKEGKLNNLIADLC
jgi:hypothetical protein